MAQTKYITVAEWAESVDDRVLAQLSGDAGAPGTVDENNAALLNCIERASSDVQSHAFRGERYNATDLDTLATDDDWTLKGLVVDLATVYLYESRGGVKPDDVANRERRAKDALEALRDGRRVFNEADAQDAGAPTVHVMSAGRRAQLNLVSDTPFFPAARTKVAL